jgi:hypothetical protein
VILSANTQQFNALSFSNKKQLVKLKQKAIRSGVWFRTLPRIDRALFDLTIKVISGSIRSATLAKSIISIVGKLGALLESKLARAIREIGFPLAYKLSLLAQKWGNQDAQEWVKDTEFARYLAIMKYNTRPCNG